MVTSSKVINRHHESKNKNYRDTKNQRKIFIIHCSEAVNIQRSWLLVWKKVKFKVLLLLFSSKLYHKVEIEISKLSMENMIHFHHYTKRPHKIKKQDNCSLLFLLVFSFFTISFLNYNNNLQIVINATYIYFRSSEWDIVAITPNLIITIIGFFQNSVCSMFSVFWIVF